MIYKITDKFNTQNSIIIETDDMPITRGDWYLHKNSNSIEYCDKIYIPSPASNNKRIMKSSRHLGHSNVVVDISLCEHIIPKKNRFLGHFYAD